MVAKILATLLRIEGLLKLFNKHQDTVLISMADYLEQPIGQPVQCDGGCGGFSSVPHVRRGDEEDPPPRAEDEGIQGSRYLQDF